jgi:hypothetical protein
MNYKISYKCNTKNNCGYFGYEFSETYIEQLFSERVRNKLIDAPGTNLLLDAFQDISATGFDNFKVSIGFFLMNNHISKIISPSYCLYIPFC